MDQMFYIRTALFNTSSLVEQEDMSQRVFNNSYEAGAKLEAVINALCSRDLRPPLMLSGLGFSGRRKRSKDECRRNRESKRGIA